MVAYRRSVTKSVGLAPLGLLRYSFSPRFAGLARRKKRGKRKGKKKQKNTPEEKSSRFRSTHPPKTKLRAATPALARGRPRGRLAHILAFMFLFHSLPKFFLVYYLLPSRGCSASPSRVRTRFSPFRCWLVSASWRIRQHSVGEPPPPKFYPHLASEWLARPLAESASPRQTWLRAKIYYCALRSTLGCP